MKLFKYIVSIGFLWLSTTLSAQSITYSGVVSDSLNNPLELANVIAINKKTKAMSSYGITDSEGRYRVNLKKDSIYILKASYLGFETWEEEILAEENSIKNIALKASPNQLSEVDVVHEFPVSISGDTIIYKADAFTDGKERKLENVLEKLPGFEVDENGEVKVQGKKVDKVLVEGKEFFDGDSKMATKNIPANAVDKVQVLRNFNDVSPMKGINDEDNIALNIKLKDGKKSMLFGDVSAGGGLDERFLLHPNLFYYSKKFSLNFIGDLNNIGEQAFTMRDYFRFNGGLKNLARKSGSTMRISSDEIGLSLMRNNRAREIDSRLGALNFSYNPNKKWSFSGFAIGSRVENDIDSNSFRTYLREEGDNEETLNSITNQITNSGLFKLSSTYTPNSKLHLAYDAFVKTASINQEGTLNSSFNTINNSILSSFDRRPFSFEQRMDLFYAMNEKSIFSFEVSHLYKKQTPTLNLISLQQPFIGVLPLQDTSPYGLFQNLKVFTNKYDAAFNYYSVLNKTNHINFTLGVNTNDQGLNSGIEEHLTEGSVNELDGQELRNEVSYNYRDIFVGIGYKTKLNKLTLNPSLNLHKYNTENNQLNTTTPFDRTMLLPSMNAKYDFKGSESLNLNYSIQAEFTDIQNLASGTVIKGYNSLFSGNPNLENAWYHSLNVNYYNFNMFSFTNIYAGLSYQKKYDDIQNILNYQGLDRLSSPINIDKANENITVFGNYEKRFTFMKVKVNTSLSHSRYNNFIDDSANENTSFSQNYKASLDSSFKEWPNFEIGFETIINKYDSNTGNSTFVTNRPFANMEAYFLKGFTLTMDYQYNDYRNRSGGTKSNYDFLNAALYYQKKGSKWEFKLSGLNLLNTTSIRQDSFSNNLISTYAYFVQPRYYMLSSKFNL